MVRVYRPSRGADVDKLARGIEVGISDLAARGNTTKR